MAAMEQAMKATKVSFTISKHPMFSRRIAKRQLTKAHQRRVRKRSVENAFAGIVSRSQMRG